MSNYHVEPVDRPQALSGEAIKSLRRAQVKGISRRHCCATRSAGRWPSGCSRSPPARSASSGRTCRAASAARSGSGRSSEIKLAERVAPDRRGLPGLLPGGTGVHRADEPGASSSSPGEDTSGDGTALNVRALYQRCPHLGCKPNPCIKNFWMECPCHGSRYDRLGIKAAGAQYGPAAAQHGPLLGVGRRRWRPDPGHRQDHARPAADRAGPAGHHPAANADGLHLMALAGRRRGSRIPMTDELEPDARAAAARDPATGAARGGPVHGRATGQVNRRPDAGAQRLDRPPVVERPLGRLPGRRRRLPVRDPLLVLRAGRAARALAAAAGAGDRAPAGRRTSSAATTSTRPTAPAATARPGSARRTRRPPRRLHRADPQQPGEAVRPPEREATCTTSCRPAAATSAATPTRRCRSGPTPATRPVR